MLVRKAFKFRLKVKSADTENYLTRVAGCMRFVWNKALSIQKKRLDSNAGLLPYNEMAALLEAEEDVKSLEVIADGGARDASSVRGNRSGYNPGLF